MRNRRLGLIFMLSLGIIAGCHSSQEFPDVIDRSQYLAPRQTLTPVPIPENFLVPMNESRIGRVWAHEGGLKVTNDELRASEAPDSVLNSVWDGKGISLFGARNEVVSFSLILEAPQFNAKNISIELEKLLGPNGFILRSRESEGTDIFDFTEREIELFFIRYLQIRGISTDLFFAGFDYDEQHIPERCRRPLDAEGNGQGTWQERPCHDLFYPEIAVPIALEDEFDILSGSNQSIWGDVYIPTSAPPGIYKGAITVKEDTQITWKIPIQLEVLDFNLPDLPTAKTMLFISRENIKEVYLGDSELSDLDEGLNEIIDRHFQIAHRHKISLIDSYLPVEDMSQVWMDRLNGDLYTEERGYDGPGKRTGNNVYSIGTYGDWPWMEDGKQVMWQETDVWANWFEAQRLGTTTEVFLYLIDESDNYRLVEKWAGWMESNQGPGKQILSLATLDLPVAVERVPSLDIPASWAHFGVTSQWQEAADLYRGDLDKRLYLYNSCRPATGSFAIEDEGTALRQLAWAQYKMNVDRWFYWEGTYYNNYQCYGDEPQAATNVFEQAQTYGCYELWDESLGETGWNYLNGDGVLFYPGTDLRYPGVSYGVAGPFASLRMKNWRRGIQDVDYLVMAAKVDPERTAALLQEMVPAVLWELGVEDLEDPTYVYSGISWPVEPDYWEAARAELAEIILLARE